MFNFKKSAAAVKMDRSTEQVLELEAQKKRLEIDVEQIRLDLDNQKKREAMKLEEESHKHKLKLQEEKAVFEREKLIWAKEKEELTARAVRERVEFETNLKKEFELKIQEAVVLTKLESEQRIKQTEIDKERAVNEVKVKYSEELAKVKADTAEEFYKKLTTAFQEIQLNGDKNSKFVHEMAIKLFDKIPANNSKVGVDVNVDTLRLAEAKSV